ncbi:MAG: hypothetical protein EBX50_18030, partial [Chitinophagia bacterium]|nr:hypothetical protein [Chitinophagia bacterium]
DCNIITGVFSNIGEVEKQYKKIYKNNEPLFTVKLKRFILDKCESSIDLSYMLDNWSRPDSVQDRATGLATQNNINIKNFKLNSDDANYMLKQQEFECEYCNGSDCQDGCVNDNCFD